MPKGKKKKKMHYNDEDENQNCVFDLEEEEANENREQQIELGDGGGGGGGGYGDEDDDGTPEHSGDESGGENGSGPWDAAEVVERSRRRGMMFTSNCFKTGTSELEQTQIEAYERYVLAQFKFTDPE